MTTPHAIFGCLRASIDGIRRYIIGMATAAGREAGATFAHAVRTVPPDQLDRSLLAGLSSWGCLHALVGDAVAAGMSDRDAYDLARDADHAYRQAASLAIAQAATRPA